MTKALGSKMTFASQFKGTKLSFSVFFWLSKLTKQLHIPFLPAVNPARDNVKSS